MIHLYSILGRRAAARELPLCKPVSAAASQRLLHCHLLLLEGHRHASPAPVQLQHPPGASKYPVPAAAPWPCTHTQIDTRCAPAAPKYNNRRRPTGKPSGRETFSISPSNSLSCLENRQLSHPRLTESTGIPP
ncbi:hypothetical protein TgHK011_003120 [Trichoderma gracile]|nr:hypothetical protein TgHK011_003120 [Trichoderma gracile]